MKPEIVPFLACGDLSGYDSDMTYRVAKDEHVPRDPVQPPIEPPYKVAAMLKQLGQL